MLRLDEERRRTLEEEGEDDDEILAVKERSNGRQEAEKEKRNVEERPRVIAKTRVRTGSQRGLQGVEGKQIRCSSPITRSINSNPWAWHHVRHSVLMHRMI